MTTRDSDARNDLLRDRPIIGYRNKITGEEITLDSSKFSEIHQRETFKSAPPLTPAEQTQAAAELQAMLDTGELNYPHVARTMLNRPDTLFLAGEVGFALSGGQITSAEHPIHALANESLEAILHSPQAPALVAEYQQQSSTDDLQQMFWSQIAASYDQQERDAFLTLLSSLDERGTKRLASRALAWAEGKDLTDPANRAALFFYIHQEAFGEQQFAIENTGIGGLLDAPENFKDDLIEGAITIANNFFGSPEDAVRRSGFTQGEQAAYQMGLRPDDDAWNVVSGITDGVGEVIQDPLNVLAGIGAGFKAVKTVDLSVDAIRAVQKGRSVAALKAFFAPTRRFSKAASNIRGGRGARAFYMLRGKALDDMLEGKAARKVVEDFQGLLREGKMAEATLRYPKLAALPGEALDIIGRVDQNVDDAIETLKAVTMTGADLSAEALDAAQLANVEAWERIGRQIDVGATRLTADETDLLNRATNGLAQHGEQQASIKAAIREVIAGGQPTAFGDQARALLKGWRANAENVGGANRWLTQVQTDEILAAGTGGRVDYLFESSAPAGSDFGTRTQRLKAIFDDKTKGLVNRLSTDDSGEVFVTGRFEIGAIDEAAKTVEMKFIDDVIPTTRPDRVGSMELLQYVNDGVDPGQLKQAMLAQANLLQLQNKTNKFYLVADAIQAPRRLNRGRFLDGVNKALGERAATIAARSTPGAPRGQIALFNNSQAVKDLDTLFRHYGIKSEKYLPVIDDFLLEDLGARQDFIFEKVLPLIGEERGIGVLKYNLIQLYKSGKLRQFSSLNNDIWVDVAGSAHRGPIFGYQFTNEVPIPVHTLDGILNRVNQAGRRGIKLRTRGLLGSTNTRRSKIAQRFQQKLAKDGVEVTDEEAWQIGYSMLSDPGNDGRGWVAAKFMQKAGTVWDKQHNFFKYMMLLGRPLPWAGRVLMEEQLRAFVNNLPSLARNPFSHLVGMHKANLLHQATKARKVTVDVAQDYINLTTKGADNVDEIVSRLGGLAGDIFPDGAPTSLSAAKRAVGKYIDAAVRDRAGINNLNTLSRVKRNARSATKKIEKADKLLDRLGLSASQVDEAFDAIQMQQISRSFISDAAGIFSPQPSVWRLGMLNDEAVVHGQRLGFHVLKSSEDTFGKLAYLRASDKLRGLPIGADRTAKAIIENPKWALLRHDMIQRFGDTDDLILAERYMDELLEPEIMHLMEPFLREADDIAKADILERLVNNKTMDFRFGGEEVQLNFNHAKSAADRVGELVADSATNPNMIWPDVATLPVDPRFTQVDSSLARKALKLFGDDFSQALNRRPAWLKIYQDWYDRFIDMGVHENAARKMANEKAVDEVSAVFFDAEMAPHFIKQLERFIPFVKATYEVASQWTYKMPVATGGYWPMGIGEFGRKLDRVMQALVETGAARIEEEDGVRSNFVLTIGDKEITLGDPLNPASFGLLSFFQFSVGANPVGTLLASEIKAKIPAANDDRRDVSQGETWADLAARLDVDPVELAQLNRTIFYDQGVGEAAYLSIIGNVADLDTIQVPEGMPIRIPQSSTASILEELILPMGEIDLGSMPMSYLPAALRNLVVGFGLGFAPADDFWRDGSLGGIDGFVPKQFKASVLSQSSEQMMYLESHDLDKDGRGPLARIMEKEKKLASMPAGNAANDLRTEIELDTQAYLKRIKEGTAGGLLVKGLLGQLIPTTPRSVREDAVEINTYWGSRNYAESLQAGVGELEVLPFENLEQVENFYALAAEWLADSTGEGAKARFARDNPELLAYLTPKTFYGSEGIPPEITAFDDYVDQIKSGERIAAPAFITAMRYYQSSIGSDFYNTYIARYGSDPTEAAALALFDRDGYREIQEERSDAYTAISFFDEMNGQQYENWRKERGNDDNWSLDRLIEERRDIQNALATLLEISEDDDVTIDAAELREDAATFRKAIALVSQSIRSLQDDEELAEFRNPFEEAYNRYFQEIYVPYNEGLSALYDKLEDTSDSERAQLVYEEIRDYRNQNELQPPIIDGVVYPTPAEYQWGGKSPEEQQIKMQQWITRPLEWMDITQTERLLEHHPALKGAVPDDLFDFDIYHRATVSKVIIDEAFEANEITSGQRTKMRKAIDAELREGLIAAGRSAEAIFLDLTPFEKLKLTNLLPPELNRQEYSEWHRYYTEVLESKEISANTIEGREIVFPFMQELTFRAESDSHFEDVVRTLGENLFGDSRLDEIFPKLFFDALER